MINTAPLRAAIAAAPGDRIEISRAQIEALLDEVEDGQVARTSLRALGAAFTPPMIGARR